MASAIPLPAILFATFIFVYFSFQFLKGKNGAKSKKLVPRAGGALPIIGHLHQFGGKELIHKQLGAMAEKYGPAFTIRLGAQENLVVSSWEMAKECFTTNDKAFSDRPKITATKLLGYNFAVFGLAPYGPYWREMRKIVTLELLSNRAIDMLSHIRVSEMSTALKELYDASTAKQGVKKVVDVKQWFADLTLNTSVKMVGGRKFVGPSADYKQDEARKRQQLMKDFLYFFGVFVVSDAIPALGWLDFQGHEKNMKKIAKELDTLLEEWLQEKKEKRRMQKEGRVDQDFMDVMLNILETADFPDFDKDTINKATCLNIILAGSDTVTVTLTWAMSLLLNNPEKLKAAQEELDAHVPRDRHVDESDIKNLVYLQSVIKETLRLYPPTPIIGLRSAMEDCTLAPGYHVPAGTRLLVNAWKIQRDANRWPEPNEFRPERFFTSHKDIDIRGHNYELIPFGSGRRACPGTNLALQLVHLALASVLHCYDFARPDGKEIDMSESAGLTNLKATPVEVYLTPRVDPQVFGV